MDDKQADDEPVDDFHAPLSAWEIACVVVPIALLFGWQVWRKYG